MKKEELICKLQMTYIGDRNAFNELVGYYDGLKQGIEELQQENKQLKERIEYLERSNNRREDEILSLRQELVDKELLKGESNEKNKDKR